jgi:preprotein translocase subunit SecE
MRDGPVVFKQRAQAEEDKSKRRVEADKGKRSKVERKDNNKDKDDDAPRKGGKSDNALIRYFQETSVELRKVAWPSREQTIRLTMIVLASVTTFAIVFGALDLLFQFIIAQLV